MCVEVCAGYWLRHVNLSLSVNHYSPEQRCRFSRALAELCLRNFIHPSKSFMHLEFLYRSIYHQNKNLLAARQQTDLIIGVFKYSESEYLTL